MAIFPDTASIKPLIGAYRKNPIENVRRNAAEAADTQIRDVWGREKFAVTFDMDLTLDDAQTVRDFCRTNRALTFDFFDYDPEKFSAETIGTGDGANLTFTIPAKETGSQGFAPVVEVNDGVASATVTAGGTGYANSFAVTFTGGGGSGAAGTATAVAGVIQSIAITSPGSGYSSNPTPVLTAGGGTGGTATAAIGAWNTRTVVTHYNITSGTGSVGQDRVIFTGGNAPPNTRTVRVTYKGRHHYTCELQGPPQTVPVNTLGRKVISVAIMEAF